MNDYPKSNVSARIYLPLDVLFCREGVCRIWQIDARKRGIWATFNVIRPTKFLRRQKSRIGEDLWQNGSSDFNNKHFWQLASWNWNWFDLRATFDSFRSAVYWLRMYHPESVEPEFRTGHAEIMS